MSGYFGSTAMLTNGGEKKLDIEEYKKMVIKDIVIHIIPLSTSKSVYRLRAIGGILKNFIPSIYHPSLTHIAIQLNLENCKDVLIIEYGQYITEDSKQIKNIFSSSSKGPRTSNNDNYYYYINKDGARITRFEDNFLKGFNETNIPKLITNLIACQHYQIPYEELLYKKKKEEEENLIQNVYNNFYRVECDIKNKIKLKELIGHFENKKWESEKYFVLSHNCQTFGAEIVKILKGIRKNEYDKVRIVEKTLLPSCIISALWHNEKLSLVNTLGRIPIFGFFHDNYYNLKNGDTYDVDKHNK